MVWSMPPSGGDARPHAATIGRLLEIAGGLGCMHACNYFTWHMCRKMFSCIPSVSEDLFFGTGSYFLFSSGCLTFRMSHSLYYII